MVDDPRAAVGGQWDLIGRLQFEFLVANGLKPQSKLLDVGCGTLRGGRHFIHYLDPGKYTGTDISQNAIADAHRLAAAEGLADRKPVLLHRRANEAFFSGFAPASFDFILAHSVFTHLPADIIEQCFAEVKRVLRPHGVFYFTFWDEPRHRRKGLKDFAHPARFFDQLAARYLLRFELRHDYQHPRGQSMASIRMNS